jgi:hypothetical protein
VVLHSESSMGWGGQEMRILSDCRGLMARDHKAVIVCPPGSRIAERAIEINCRCKKLAKNEPILTDRK